VHPRKVHAVPQLLLPLPPAAQQQTRHLLPLVAACRLVGPGLPGVAGCLLLLWLLVARRLLLLLPPQPTLG